ncbi:MAG TPA: fibronectin type III domain-containing protein [Candidatus Saccharimonadales bacterium]|nr:fibronectin type III domain-containing protein [Candidatus Saccharimonadales bacterium]
MNILQIPFRRARILVGLTGITLVAVLLSVSLFAHPSAAASPSFKQAKANEISSGNSNSVTFASANTAGDLIVVYVLWNNTDAVNLSDSLGNTYAAATAKTSWGGGSSQAFYAKNILGGTNTVKATFATNINAYAIVQTHEYAGMSKTNPLESTVGTTGSGTAMNSGSLTTATANDLLFAASGSVGSVKSISSAYTGRLTTSGNRTMDRVAAAPGSYNATATNSNGGWTLQLIAFRPDSGVDTTAPTSPTNATANAVSSSQINLSWTASTDNVGVTGYQIERCLGAGCTAFVPLATVTSPSYNDTGLSAATTYSYRLKAVDAAGNASAYTNSFQATTLAPADAQAPSVPTDLASTSATETQVGLSWSPATDNTGVAGYKIYRNGTMVGTSATTTFTDQNLTPNTSYTYAVSAYDAGGNESAQSASLVATTLADSATPTVPTNVTVQAVSSSKVTVSWNAATDNVSVAGYKVYRDGVQIALTTAPTYQDTTVSANTTYSYTVSAYDVAGNESAQSAATAVTTPAVSTNSCALPAYPNASCTGMPSTIQPATVTGDYTATTDGEVIDARHITGDLIIWANNVVIKNSQIDGSVDNEHGAAHYSFTITDTTVGPATGCIGFPGIGESDFTATRVQVRGHDDGFRMGGSNVTITDSYANLCWNPPSASQPDGSHSDGIQNYCGGICSNLVLSHNTIDAQTVNNAHGDARTVYLGSNSDGAGISNITVTDNLLRGGGYTIYSEYRGGAAWIFRDNRIVNNSWQYAAVTAEGTCANQNWTGNSLVTIDSLYNVTSTVSPLACIQ